MIWIVGILVALLVFYCAFLLVASVVSVFPPRIPVFLSPAQLGLPQERVEFTTSDGVKIRGWWVPGDSRTVVICMHGYFANRCELAPYSLKFHELGANVLLFDHRCHGSSERAMCTFGKDERLDVIAAVEFASTMVKNPEIILFGSSMGAVAGLRAACELDGQVKGLILDSAYRRLDEAAHGFWKIGGLGPFGKFMGPTVTVGRIWFKADPKKVVTKPFFESVQSKQILLLYGDKDTVVPQDAAIECVAACGPGAEVVWFEGCAHGQGRYVDPHRYIDALGDFITSRGLINRD